MAMTAAEPALDDSAIEQSVVRKVIRHISPILALCYFAAILDRSNVGYAGLTMNKDLAFTATVFGFGTGIFFIGYFIFEVPSNIVLEKVGARLWIARIMLSWGLVSAGTAFVWNDYSFYVMRFLLGAAEAGFIPGAYYYLTFWAPSRHRSKLVALVAVMGSITGAISGPVSGWILDTFTGTWGLASWQWLFLLEATPSIVMAAVVLAGLCGSPAEAKWLTDAERRWLARTLDGERAGREAVHKLTLGAALRHPRVLILCAVYFGIVIGNGGSGVFLPQIVKGFSLTNTQVGWVLVAPNLLTALAVILWSRHSDKTDERYWHAILPILVAASGLVCVALSGSPILSFIGITMTILGSWCAIVVFWTFPTMFLSGTAAAGGIALINSTGNLGGFVGPYFVGWIKDRTGGFGGGLLALATVMVLNIVLILVVAQAMRRDDRQRLALAAD
jgi:ACS family tartrate transporter-like MFS transporter